MNKKNTDFTSLENGQDNNIISANDMIRIEKDFSGYQWFMERMRPGQGINEGICDLPNELSGNDFSWNIAHVPGDVYTDLYNAGEIDDPLVGRNMGRAKWVEDYEWWYTYSFNVPENMMGKNLTLLFEGIDYSCDVWFNTKHLGHHEGMMSSFEYDITDIIDTSEPHVPCNKVLIKLDPPPKNQHNFAGMKHNFAGDYLSGLIPFGIWKPVKLIATQKIKINNYRIETKLNNDNSADVSFEIDLKSFEKIPLNCTAKFELSDGKNSYKCFAELNNVTNENNKVYAKMTVKNPKLWWPYELGYPYLYSLTVTVYEDGKALDRITDRVGLREITMKLNPGFTPDESQIPWTFVVNGKEMFLRSACWGGQPSFFYGRNSTEKYEFYLNKAKECNINNLRIFGWHPAETDEFYSICDRLGITVWTNFAFATQVLRDDKPYIDKIKYEISQVVTDRRNHPSTIMWMGGEEVYFSQAHVKSSNKKIMKLLGEITNSLTNVPYADASPLSSKEGMALGYKSKESVHANSHYYAAGAILMEEYYPKLDYAIIPELTAASAPDVSSLKKFIPENELWPMGMSWGYHAADIHILQILNYEVTGSTCMDSLAHFVKATQLAQGTIFQFALEHFRRCKPHCSGVALCHFITNWPIIKWDIIDYYGQKKLSYDFVKNAYRPLLPSLEFPKRRYLPDEIFKADLFVVNDYYKEYHDITYTYEISNNEGNIIKKENFKVDISENSSNNYKSISCKINGNIGGKFKIHLELTDKVGHILSDNEYTLLIDDQKEAKAELMKMYEKMHEARDVYGRGYYRYTPDLIDDK